MSSSLALVPVPQRRKVGVVTGSFALLLAVVGILPWTTSAALSIRLLSVVALGVAAFFALVSWGMFRSAQIAQSELAFTAAVQSVIADADLGCSCGHDHDPDHLEFADGPAEGCSPIVHHTGSSHGDGHECAGAGDCAGSDSPACATCVLSSR